MNIVTVFKALGNDARMKIVRLLLDERMCICDLIDTLELSQPTVSHHVKILKQAGVIDDFKRGKWTFYEINQDTISKLENGLQQELFNPARQGAWEEKPLPTGRC